MVFLNFDSPLSWELFSSGLFGADPPPRCANGRLPTELLLVFISVVNRFTSLLLVSPPNAVSLANDEVRAALVVPTLTLS